MIKWFRQRLTWRYVSRRVPLGIWQIRGAWIDWRFGGTTFVNEPSRFKHVGAHLVQSLDYENCAATTRLIQVQPDDVLVDVGCATGRMLNWWLACGFRNRMIGVELDPEIAEKTRRRLSPQKNVEIITGDAADCTPLSATVCYLFSPFSREVLQRWHDRILEHSLSGRLTVLYVNPQFLDVFEQSRRWSIAIRRIPWFRVAVCTRTNPDVRSHSSQPA